MCLGDQPWRVPKFFPLHVLELTKLRVTVDTVSALLNERST